jgi:hypothetical protein
MEAISIQTAFPLAAIPFATSIVTVLGSPKAGPAQPRALIGGHLLSTLVGVLMVKICGPTPWAAAVAVGLAMVAMHLTRCFHPPAGIDPLVVVANDLSWSFLIVPVSVGALRPGVFDAVAPRVGSVRPARERNDVVFVRFRRVAGRAVSCGSYARLPERRRAGARR